MQQVAPSAVEIKRDADGRFEGISLRESMLATVVLQGGQSWSQPILLYGPDSTADIELLTASDPAAWVVLRSFRDLSRALRTGRRYEEIEARLDARLYEHVDRNARSRLADILAGRSSLDDLISFVLRGASGDREFSEAYLAEDFVADIERVANTHGVVIPWQIRDSLLAPFLLAVWKRRARLRPLIIHAPRRFGVPEGGGVEVATSSVSFSALADEVERVYGLKPGDVEKAYRVWQLSRSDNTTEKAQATTPRSVALETARSFLGVYTRASTERSTGEIAIQRPAPLIFELGADTIGIRQSLTGTDPLSVVAGAARTLWRQVQRLRSDPMFGNIVPSGPDILSVVESLLEQILTGSYGDGEVVELGLELNALQWHVDAVRSNLSDVSIGELTGLFATSTLFLGRFATWLEYTGSAAPAGSPNDGLAAFNLARDLLLDAKGRTEFLTLEAHKRVVDVLERTAADEDAPSLREGLVRSGENLAAVTVNGLSTVVAREAKALGGKVKDKSYDEASEALVKFAVKNAPTLFRLAELRQWPWLKWLHDVLT